jgi:hypothetical protein
VEVCIEDEAKYDDEDDEEEAEEDDDGLALEEEADKEVDEVTEEELMLLDDSGTAIELDVAAVEVEEYSRREEVDDGAGIEELEEEEEI